MSGFVTQLDTITLTCRTDGLNTFFTDLFRSFFPKVFKEFTDFDTLAHFFLGCDLFTHCLYGVLWNKSAGNQFLAR